MPEDAPEEFLSAIDRLRAVRLRPEVVIEEVPAPQRIAPHAAAISADVVVDDEELATGRFVVLYDPAGQDAWEGTFRAVTFVRAALEAELGADPMIGQIGWTWLQESLDSAGVSYAAAGGTVTRVVSESYGALSDRRGPRSTTSPRTSPPGRPCCAPWAGCRRCRRAWRHSPAGAEPPREHLSR
jgi:hypothetical protein